MGFSRTKRKTQTRGTTSRKKRSTRYQSKRRRVPLRFLTGGIEREANTDCPICLDDLIAGDKISECNSCKNIFHKKCVEKWCAGKARCPCPYCRQLNTFVKNEPIEHRTTNEFIDTGIRQPARRRRRGEPRLPPHAPHNNYYNDMMGL